MGFEIRNLIFNLCVNIFPIWEAPCTSKIFFKPSYHSVWVVTKVFSMETVSKPFSFISSSELQHCIKPLTYFLPHNRCLDQINSSWFSILILVCIIFFYQMEISRLTEMMSFSNQFWVYCQVRENILGFSWPSIIPHSSLYQKLEKTLFSPGSYFSKRENKFSYFLSCS